MSEPETATHWPMVSTVLAAAVALLCVVALPFDARSIGPGFLLGNGFCLILHSLMRKWNV